jgi:short-subunit dehydrogenase
VNYNISRRYGSVALVTGASSGIGEAFCKRLAAEGLTVIAVARREERLLQLQEFVAVTGLGRIVPVVADLAQANGVDIIVKAVETSGLAVDVLVNNAGVGFLGPLDTVPREKTIGMIDLNCRAVVDMTLRFLPGMKTRKRGAVIILSSLVCTIPAPWFSAYSATKAFDLYFGESLYGECKGTGVDVLTVLPGLTRTEFQAGSGMREYHSPYRSADHVVASALSALGKQPIVVDGWFNKILSHGTRFIPRSLLLFISRLIMKKELGAMLEAR